MEIFMLQDESVTACFAITLSLICAMVRLLDTKPYSRELVRLRTKEQCHNFVKAAVSMVGSEGDHICNPYWGVPVGSLVLWPECVARQSDISQKTKMLWSLVGPHRDTGLHIVVDTSHPLVAELAKASSGIG